MYKLYNLHKYEYIHSICIGFNELIHTLSILFMYD